MTITLERVGDLVVVRLEDGRRSGTFTLTPEQAIELADAIEETATGGLGDSLDDPLARIEELGA